MRRGSKNYVHSLQLCRLIWHLFYIFFFFEGSCFCCVCSIAFHAFDALHAHLQCNSIIYSFSFPSVCFKLSRARPLSLYRKFEHLLQLELLQHEQYKERNIFRIYKKSILVTHAHTKSLFTLM